MDPSPHMIELANKKKGVIGKVFDPYTISKSNKNIPEKYLKVDLILLSCCVHYIAPE